MRVNTVTFRVYRDNVILSEFKHKEQVSKSHKFTGKGKDFILETIMSMLTSLVYGGMLGKLDQWESTIVVRDAYTELEQIVIGYNLNPKRTTRVIEMNSEYSVSVVVETIVKKYTKKRNEVGKIRH